MNSDKPLMVCLYAGLHGWEEGAVAAGFRCVGYDIVDMCELYNMPRPDNCELILRDVRSIHGSELKDAALIVGSSPCQEFSYRAMPWKRARALGPPILGMELFNTQFRIQREAIEAAGHHIPMVVENVRGAQKWVGRAQWHYGSFYLWGDVPALMPMTLQWKSPGKNWSEWKGGEPGQERPESVRPWGNAVKHDGVKFSQSGDMWFDGKPRDKMLGDKGPAAYSSKSPSRKMASAMIARIPFPLSSYIALAFLPHP